LYPMFSKSLGVNKKQALSQCILRIKLFLRKSSIIFVLIQKKVNSIFMKGNSIFSKCAFKHHFKNVAGGLADS
jgi:hypothetical protein